MLFLFFDRRNKYDTLTFKYSYTFKMLMGIRIPLSTIPPAPHALTLTREQSQAAFEFAPPKLQPHHELISMELHVQSEHHCSPQDPRPSPEQHCSPHDAQDPQPSPLDLQDVQDPQPSPLDLQDAQDPQPSPEQHCSPQEIKLSWDPHQCSSQGFEGDPEVKEICGIQEVRQVLNPLQGHHVAIDDTNSTIPVPISGTSCQNSHVEITPEGDSKTINFPSAAKSTIKKNRKKPHSNLTRLTREKLATLCGDMGLETTGTRKDLIKRLKNAA